MTAHVVFMVLSLIAATIGTVVRNKDAKLIAWPSAYALMSAAVILKG